MDQGWSGSLIGSRWLLIGALSDLNHGVICCLANPYLHVVTPHFGLMSSDAIPFLHSDLELPVIAGNDLDMTMPREPHVRSQS